MIYDVGCGPGHVASYLARQHRHVVGLDVSSAMIDIARQRFSGPTFVVRSMLSLPVEDAALAGVVSLYSIIHLAPADRTSACREFARVIRPGGWLLIAFHVDSTEFEIGMVNHLTCWFGKIVELDGYFLDPGDVAAQLEQAGFTVRARLERQALGGGVEYPSRRCYLLAQR